MSKFLSQFPQGLEPQSSGKTDNSRSKGPGLITKRAEKPDGRSKITLLAAGRRGLLINVMIDTPVDMWFDLKCNSKSDGWL